MDQSAPSSRRFGSRGLDLPFSDIRAQSYLQEGSDLPCQPGSSEREGGDCEGGAVDLSWIGQASDEDEKDGHQGDLEEIGEHRDEHGARRI